MKKGLLFVSVLLTGWASAQCSDLIISEYVEGAGNDKAIELYNPTMNTIDLSGYTLERYSNGSNTTASGGVLALTGSIASGATFVIVNGQTTGSPSSPACDPMLQAFADQLDGVYPAPTYMNGNDAIGLLKNGVLVDLLGKTGDASISTAQGWGDIFPYDGSSGAIWTKDHTLIRKATATTGVTSNPTAFIVNTEWDSLPRGTWTMLGSHTCNCPTASINELTNTVNFAIYPNPFNGGELNFKADANIVKVEVINALGQVVLTKEFTDLSNHKVLTTSDLSKGMYTARLKFDNQSVSLTNLVVQ